MHGRGLPEAGDGWRHAHRCRAHGCPDRRPVRRAADGEAILDAARNVALWSTDTSKQTYAVIELPARGWGPDQFGCLNSIWVRESGWNELAGHPASAYGIPQADPGSKMAAEGSEWLTNPQTQIRWGEDYIRSRYGTPCQAWAYWQARRYYGPLLAVVLGTD